MKDNDSAIVLASTAVPVQRSATGGLWWGLLGVVAFSWTVPMTRIAGPGFSPLLVGAGRAVLAAALAAAALALTRQPLPRAGQLARLAVVGLGVVLGFPLLTSYALETVGAAHAAVVIAVLPAATAVATVARTGERPGPVFWLASLVGCVAVALTTGLSGAAGFSLSWADLLLVGAVAAAALGYAEGGMLARELGAWQTISWALLLCFPLTAALTVTAWVDQAPQASAGQWAAFGYLGAVSMFGGFVAWYRGLALGPMAQVSQTQLVQPLLTLTWATAVLDEPFSLTTAVGAAVVVAGTAGAVRSRSH